MPSPWDTGKSILVFSVRCIVEATGVEFIDDSQADQQLLRSARDKVDVLPDVLLKSRSLALPL